MENRMKEPEGRASAQNSTQKGHHSKRPENDAAATESTRQSRSLRILAATLIAILVFAGVAGSFYAWNSSHTENQSAKDTPVDKARTEKSSPSSTPSPAPTPTPTASPEFAWRDANFAVDPAKNTWNYESNGEKIVYLTFDDGPSQNTEKVLKILDDYDAKATFFVVGYNSDYYPLIGEAYRRGHTIGLHTYSHNYASVYSSPEAYYADLDQIGAVVKEQIGYVPAFIRFPGGSSNTVSRKYTPGIMSELSRSVQERGYQYYDWNASCGDGSNYPTDVLISEAKRFGDKDNVILLLHDATAKNATVEALPHIIEYYKSLGYTFKALDRETMVPHHGINN